MSDPNSAQTKNVHFPSNGISNKVSLSWSFLFHVSSFSAATHRFLCYIRIAKDILLLFNCSQVLEAKHMTLIEFRVKKFGQFIVSLVLIYGLQSIVAFLVLHRALFVLDSISFSVSFGCWTFYGPFLDMLFLFRHILHESLSVIGEAGNKLHVSLDFTQRTTEYRLFVRISVGFWCFVNETLSIRLPSYRYLISTHAQKPASSPHVPRLKRTVSTISSIAIHPLLYLSHIQWFDRRFHEFVVLIRNTWHNLCCSSHQKYVHNVCCQ